MQSWRKALEDPFTAVAFAEAGEHETARALVPQSNLWARLASWADNLRETFAAVAFAEAGVPDLYPSLAARDVPAGPATAASLEDFMAEVGLSGVPALYAVARL